MKAAALAFFFVSNLAAASVELAGVFIDSTDSRFLLTDNSTGVASEWLKIGESFQGYLVVSYNAESEVLDVKSGDSTLHLHLRTPAKQLARPLPTEEDKKERRVRFSAWVADQAFNYANVILADVTIDGPFAYITPREVWKGSDFPVGTPIRIPHQFGFGGFSGGAGSYVMALNSEDPFNNQWTYTGAASVLLEDFRTHKNRANQSPEPTLASGTSPAGQETRLR